jgi:mannose-6-phosphate isomerase-like protein (cupin superfamily)
MTIGTREGVQAYVLQSGEGERIENLHLRFMATNEQTGGALMAGECFNPGPGGPPLHVHYSHDELYLVLQGRYRFQIGQDVHEGGAGMFAYVPRGTSHTFASVGPEEGRIFAMSLPGLDEFIRRMSTLQTGGVDQSEMVDLFHDFDSEITGPPLV